LTKTTLLTTLTLLVLITLAMAPAFTVASPELQANTMYKVKTSTSIIEPNALGANHPYYAPFDIRAAYSIPTGGDKGTIAIIDAYDNPKAVADLNYFDQVFTWPATTLEVVKMSSLLSANSGWALESDLDVQWAHAVAPDAHLLLVEAKSASIADLIAAVDYANSRTDVVAISMSWGSSENSGLLSYDSHFTTTGKVYFASSGDVGGVVSWPSSSPNVVSVGGTSLIQTSNGYTESAWSSGGGGVSTIEQTPNYQATALSNLYSKRATPDVSYNADPNNGFLVYDSYGYNGGRGWFVVGGTSAGAPQWAAISTYGNTANNINFYSTYPNSYGATFTDVQTGSNGYPTKSGYDLATGIGSPIGVVFGGPITPDFSLSTNPSTVIINTRTASQGTTAVSVNAIGAYAGSLTLSAIEANNPPAGLGLSFGPQPINAGQASTLTITVPTGIATGTYPVTITGTDGTLVHTTTMNVQVVNPDFALTANPTSLSIKRGNTATSTITVNPKGGYTGTPTLAATGNPSGMTISFRPNPVTSGLSTMTITTKQNMQTGTYTLTITGTDSGLSRTTQVTVTVR
jgi:subtilase family serine protease